ncbi:MAG: fused MFS/spermidine synthase [Nitrospirae bacterium]|nr:fused MFS/spermidine synthase [Nitrospirota bacterium]
MKNRFFRFLSLCFFLSGATALIYEVIWVRLFTLTFGNTVYAVGVVLTAFMSGLSLGSFLLGRWADRDINLLKAYAILEAGIGVYALVSPELISSMTSFYISVSPLGMPLWMLQGLRYSLSIMALLIPTTLMGGTLPVLSRYFIRSHGELEKRVGRLYAINTIGGVIGVFLAGFILIRFFGLSFSLMLTAFLNIGIGIITFYLGTTIPKADMTEGIPIRMLSEERPSGYRYAIFAFFFSGFSAMLYEVAWSRQLVAIIGSATYSFSLILMGFLSGIGIGSMIVSRVSDRHKPGLFHFSAIELLIGITCFSTLFLFNLLPPLMLKGLQLTESYNTVLTLEFLLVLVFILVPTILFGATFPIIAGVYSKEGHTGKSIGNIYAVNTTGCILGSAVSAFLLLPSLGSVMSVKIAVAINIAIGIVGLAVLGRRYLLAASTVLFIVPFIPISIPNEYLDSGVSIYGKRSDYSLNQKNVFYLYQKEGLNATISVRANAEGNISLRTNGKTDASFYDMPTQLALGYFPVLLHPEPEDALVIGFGSGATVRAVLDYPKISHVDCIEIEPAVIEAGRFFERASEKALHDPRLSLFIEDARSYIVSSKKKYDIIISEPSNPWISGIGNLFSKEFYETASRLLDEEGIFCQWVQLYSLRQEDLKMILRTFSSVFPECSIWNSKTGDILVIGSKKPLRLDYRAVSDKLRGKMAWKLKAYFNISEPLDFFSFFLVGKTGIEKLSDGAPLNTDDIPFLEFNAPLSIYADTTMQNITTLFRHMELPPIVGTKMTNDIVSELFYRKCTNYMYIGMLYNIKWIEDALSISPKNPNYILRHAKVLEANQKTKEAQTLIRKALSLAPNNAHANFEMAMLMRNIDRQKADAYFQKAVSLDGNEFVFLSETGNFKLFNGNLKEALGYFLKAVESPHGILEDSSLFYKIGVCYMKLKSYDEAVHYLKASVEANPFNGESLFTLADSYLLTKNTEPVCRLYKDALRLVEEERKAVIEKRIRQYCR